MPQIDLADVAPQLFSLVVLIGLSAFFSGTEVAMFSIRRVDRKQLLRSEHRRDSLLLSLLSRPRRLIATILVGNECVNVSISVFAASMIEQMFIGQSSIMLAFLATVMTLPLLLLFGEITPKTIAIKTPLGWARRAARPLWLFGFVVAPVRAIVRFAADAIVRPFGASTESAGPADLSEEEFKALVAAGRGDGELNAREQRFIHNVFEFGDKTVAQVMQPRDTVFALSYKLPVARLIKEIAERGYSRVPIYQGSKDNIRGVLYAKDLVIQGTGLRPPNRLSELLHEPIFVVQTTPVERLMRIFKQRKTHMALVVNEYGKLAGIVTMEDVLEELFGEIHDEREQQKADASRSIPTAVSTEIERIEPEDLAGPFDPERP